MTTATRRTLACAALAAAALGLALARLPGADGAATGDAATPGERSYAPVLTTDEPESGAAAHLVPLFPSAADARREGFVRVINRSAVAGEVAIAAIDDAGRRAERVTLAVGASEAVHFNSHDLEQGNPEKGLSGGVGASGEGDWRLEFSSALDIEVLAYVRAAGGFLTAMHDVVGRGLAGWNPQPGSARGYPSHEYRVAIFNPGRNRNQASLLRLINPGAEEAVVTITGIDDAGVASAGGVTVTLPAGGAATVAAAALESAHERGDSAANAEGASPLTGALGAGTGKWQLRVTSEQPVVAMSLLVSPTGHLTNLSTAPYRSVAAGPVIRAVAENTEGGAPIGDPVTVDLGAAAVPTHRLEGADAESFAVDAASGQLRTREGTDYNFETKAAYALTVVVADGLGGVVGIPVTVEVTDEDEPPAKPGAPEVEGSSSRSVLVRWEEPANRGPAITDYDVDYRRPGAAEYTDAEHEGVGREIEITHLRQRADYEFRVRASNDEGTGEWSEPTVGRSRSGGGGSGGGATPPPPAPNAPPVFTGPSSFAIPENTLAVDAIEARDPDDRITGYAIAGGVDGALFEIAADSGALAFVLAPDYERPTDVESADPPNAAGDNAYVVTVSVTGGAGGRARETEQTVTVAVTDTRLEAPSPPTVTALSSTRLLVEWTRPENSGPAIADYDVQYRAEREDEFSDAGYDGPGFAATLADLDPDTVYEAQVRAQNADVPSRWSLAGVGTTSANQPPAFLEPPPRPSVLENAGPGEDIGARVRASDPNGDPLTYRLGGLDAALFGIEPDTGQLTTGMGAGYDHEARDSHELTVTADDGHGGRATVDVTVAVTDVPEPPRTPLAPAVAASTRNSLDVGWTAPENAGRPVIDDYDVRYRVDGLGAFRDWDHAGAGTRATIANLDASTDYEVQVRANNDEGTSRWSPSVVGRTELNRAPTFAEGPSAIRELRENAAAETNVGAPLRATDVDGGTPRYGLEGPDAGSFGIVETSGQLRTRTGVDYNYEERTDYAVTARATDDQGGSATIAVTVRVTDVAGEAPDAPAAPAVRQTTAPTSLEVTWLAPANAGPPIDDYDYRYRIDAAGADWTEVIDTPIPNTEADIDGLSPATPYAVQVRARNAEGLGGWSASGSGMTGAGHPDLVPSLAVDDPAPWTGTSFTLTATVHNRGTGPSEATTVRYLRSVDATISAGDSEIGTANVGALPVGGQGTGSLSVTAAATPGTDYYGACAAPVARETQTGNNCSAAVRVTVREPTVPTVSSVAFSSTPGAGQSDNYRLGDTIEITATFSESVTVTGTPRVALILGAAPRAAEYAGGSPGARLAFRYTVAAGDEDGDGASIETDGLDAGGGSIRKTGSSIDADLAHAGRKDEPGQRVDGVRPELAAARLNGAELSLTFSEPLAPDPVPARGSFAVAADGVPLPVRAVAVRDADVVLTLASPATLARNVTVGHAPAGGVLDRARNAAAGFADAPVRNVVNIVFVLADDHATRAVSSYGSDLVSTPGIDRLAAEGVVFDRALAPNAICQPARATLLTGRYPHRHGQQNNHSTFDNDQEQVQKTLRAAGYRTALLGKWHLTMDPQGFDHWEVLSEASGQGVYYDPRFAVRDGLPVRRDGYSTDIVTDRAIAWIDDQRSDEQPFLALVWYKAAHSPWDAAVEDVTRFEELTYAPPATFRDVYAGRATATGLQKMRVDRHMDDRKLKLSLPSSVPFEIRQALFDRRPPDGDAEAVRDWKLQTYLHDYARVVHRVDQNVGRLLDYLDTAGLADDTLVVYASDQGFFLGEHGWFGKRWFHEESLRLPLIVRAPGAAGAGTRVANIVSQTDLAPTLLEVAGTDAPEGMQGASLVPFLRGVEPADWRDSFYYHFLECPGVRRVARHRAVVTDRYKLVHYYQSDEWELFDRLTDPEEVENVVAEAGYADRVSTLKAELERLRQELGDTGPNEPEHNAPAFDGDSATRAIFENSTGADVGARMRDAWGRTYRYSLASGDAETFAVVPCDGQIVTRPDAILDYEASKVHSLVVQVEDSRGRTDSIDVTVVVFDVDEPPDAPSAPVVTARTATSLTVAWTAPDNAGRPEISDYDYRYRIAGPANEFTHVDDTPITATETTISGLQPGTEYEVQVRASNDEGTGPWSDSVTSPHGSNGGFHNVRAMPDTPGVPVVADRVDRRVRQRGPARPERRGDGRRRPARDGARPGNRRPVVEGPRHA